MAPNPNRRFRRNINFIIHINLNDFSVDNPELDYDFLLPLIFSFRRKRSKRHREKMKKKLAKNLIKLEPGEQCTICLTNFEKEEEGRQFKCKHMFHKECIDEWVLKNEETCPVCRKYVF